MCAADVSGVQCHCYIFQESRYADERADEQGSIVDGTPCGFRNEFRMCYAPCPPAPAT